VRLLRNFALLSDASRNGFLPRLVASFFLVGLFVYSSPTPIIEPPEFQHPIIAHPPVIKVAHKKKRLVMIKGSGKCWMALVACGVKIPGVNISRPETYAVTVRQFIQAIESIDSEQKVVYFQLAEQDDGDLHLTATRLLARPSWTIEWHERMVADNWFTRPETIELLLPFVDRLIGAGEDDPNARSDAFKAVFGPEVLAAASFDVAVSAALSGLEQLRENFEGHLPMHANSLPPLPLDPGSVIPDWVSIPQLPPFPLPVDLQYAFDLLSAAGSTVADVINGLATGVDIAVPLICPAFRLYAFFTRNFDQPHSPARIYDRAKSYVPVFPEIDLSACEMRVALHDVAQPGAPAPGHVDPFLDRIFQRSSEYHGNGPVVQAITQDITAEYRNLYQRRLAMPQLLVPSSAPASSLERLAESFSEFRVVRSTHDHPHGVAQAVRQAFFSSAVNRMQALPGFTHVHGVGLSPHQAARMPRIAHNCGPELTGRDRLRHNHTYAINDTDFFRAISDDHCLQDCRLRSDATLSFAPFSAGDIPVGEFAQSMIRLNVNRAWVLINLPVPFLDKRVDVYEDTLNGFRYERRDENVYMFFTSSASAGYSNNADALLSWCSPLPAIKGYHLQLEEVRSFGTTYWLELRVIAGRQEIIPSMFSVEENSFTTLPLVRPWWVHRSPNLVHEPRYYSIPTRRFRALVSFLATVDEKDLQFRPAANKLRGQLAEVKIGKTIVENRLDLSITEFYATVNHALVCVFRQRMEFDFTHGRMIGDIKAEFRRRGMLFFPQFLSDLFTLQISQKRRALDPTRFERFISWLTLQSYDPSESDFEYAAAGKYRIVSGLRSYEPPRLISTLSSIVGCAERNVLRVADFFSRRTPPTAGLLIAAAPASDGTISVSSAVQGHISAVETAVSEQEAVGEADFPLPAGLLLTRKADIALKDTCIDGLSNKDYFLPSDFASESRSVGELVYQSGVFEPVPSLVSGDTSVSASDDDDTSEYDDCAAQSVSHLEFWEDYQHCPEFHLRPCASPAPPSTLHSGELDSVYIDVVEAPAVVPPGLSVAAPPPIATRALSERSVEFEPPAPYSAPSTISPRSRTHSEDPPLTSSSVDVDAPPLDHKFGYSLDYSIPQIDAAELDELYHGEPIDFATPVWSSGSNNLIDDSFRAKFADSRAFLTALRNNEAIDVVAPTIGLSPLVAMSLSIAPPRDTARPGDLYRQVRVPGSEDDANWFVPEAIMDGSTEGLREHIETFYRHRLSRSEHFSAPALVLDGLPGAAKSSLMVAYIEANPRTRFHIAVPSRKLALQWRTKLSGFRNASVQTFHRIPTKCHVIILDEVYAFALPHLNAWRSYASNLGARLVLLGDHLQSTGVGTVDVYDPILTRRRLTITISNTMPLDALALSLRVCVPEHDRHRLLYRTRNTVRSSLRFYAHVDQSQIVVPESAVAFICRKDLLCTDDFELSIGQVQGMRAPETVLYIHEGPILINWLTTHGPHLFVALSRHSSVMHIICSHLYVNPLARYPLVRPTLVRGLYDAALKMRTVFPDALDVLTELKEVPSVTLEAGWNLDYNHGTAEISRSVNRVPAESSGDSVFFRDVAAPSIDEIQGFIYKHTNFDSFKDHEHAIDFVGGSRGLKMLGELGPLSRVVDVRGPFDDADKIAEIQVSSSRFEDARNVLLRNFNVARNYATQSDCVAEAHLILDRFNKCVFRRLCPDRPEPYV